MRSAVRLLLASCLPLVTAGAAAAQGLSSSGRDPGCALRIDTATTNWVIRGYDPFSANEPVMSYDVLFVNEGEGQCRFRPVFQVDQEPFGLRATGGAPIPYTLVDETAGYDATPRAGRTVRRVNNPAVTISGRGQTMVRYTFNVDGGSLPGDGLYSQNLSLQAESTDGAPLADRRLILGVEVLPSAVMSLVGAFKRVNGQADVDLGELSEGVPNVPLHLKVRSTRAFRLELESLNGGKLRLAGTDWSVPYQVIIDGRSIPLGSGGGYASARKSGKQSENLPVAFYIGDASQKRAGVYSDVLTVGVAVD